MNAFSKARPSMQIMGGSSHSELTHLVARKVGVKVIPIESKKFSNKETSVELTENVCAQNIYIIQTGGNGRNPNDDLMELLLIINACRVSGAMEVIPILPLFPYCRENKKDGNRVSITCRLVADMLKKAGATHVMILDPPIPQVDGFFSLPVDSLRMEALFIDWIRRNIPYWMECLVVSPDETNVSRGISLAEGLGLDFSLIFHRNKTRGYTNDSRPTSSLSTGMSESSFFIDDFAKITGDVSGRRVILIDAVIDAGDTVLSALKLLKRLDALEVYVLASHGLFSSNTIDRIFDIDEDHDDTFIKAVVVSNSLPHDQSLLNRDKLHVIDISGLISEFIRRHYYRESVSILSNLQTIKEENSFNEDMSNIDDGSFSIDTVKKLRKGFRLSSVCWE